MANESEPAAGTVVTGTVVSATEASRSFSSLLDRVARGERFLVERHGTRVCLMTSPPCEARRASECLALVRERAPVLLDDRFRRDLREIISTEPPDDRPWGC